jgi:dipeptidyl aminopeptidase/acylaminoacyl peptidase
LPGRDLRFGEPSRLTCARPFESHALRRQIYFDSGGQPNQLAFYYTPLTATTTSQLPILLAVYPGPADSWECASLPLTAAGYVVLATGPAYSFDLETDIDELARLLDFARKGHFPEGNGRQIAVLGGSYSSLHVQRLLQRREPVQAALLLGPPADLFDMRRRLEEGSYVPPFGLDKALIALGFPDREALIYWQYSGAYHVRGDFPPLAILHSRSDEVVPYQQSELLARNLALVGAQSEVYFFDGASHYLLAEEGDADSLRIYELTVDFLATYLK